MIWDVDIGWLFMAVSAVAAFAYMLALLMESTLGGETLGPFGNATLITAGFFLAIIAVNYQGIAVSELKMAMVVGLAGSFLLLFFVLLVRGIWARF
ncbi:MAG: hypothetical protein JJ911_00910 [Rhizobiaceae bacterium]|jgi:hypothetical protein|nr:hypothetical protein [Rhizobiaceae bacterium]